MPKTTTAKTKAKRARRIALSDPVPGIDFREEAEAIDRIMGRGIVPPAEAAPFALKR